MAKRHQESSKHTRKVFLVVKASTRVRSFSVNVVLDVDRLRTCRNNIHP